MRLLLVEDSELLGTAIQKGFVRSGYAVDWSRGGKDALSALASCEYDCVLLDLGLPDLGGDILLKIIRSRGIPVSVIVVTARGNIQDRVRLLDMGADDYMVKPLDLDEVASRVRAVLRRAPGRVPTSGEPEHGLLKLYPSHRMATWNGNVVPLTNKEFWLLEILVRRKSQVLSRSQLEEALYTFDAEVESNAVEVYVHYLRRKFSPELILTVRGVGYQLGPERWDA
ncbi:response regulator transcription factor [Variovorax ginsengisoli]|jgi:DNA-binding response OmpR family regulator|uniref:Response regulator transcription factor n=1 Tax=Variovorax ginsengisoli TaxID=363844 RepID=A0ABT8SCV1_9BURK|nr:response regulator transcription factor [Variovorax ginsengisoli]MDN8616096.1 response regulator transcription factor [Variovorax ginsengisoli]MDO1535266.1 response regulator transcription factor [Variovorax ginsengisoli]